MDLFLLIGQSNMAGFGKLADVPPIHHNRVQMWRQMGFVPAQEPLHQDHPSNGIGLGMRFGEMIAEAQPDVQVGLIPCAVSGTAIRRWVPGADLYQRALRRTRLAQEFGTLKGILWLQGESDAGSLKAAHAHLPQFVEMLHALRHDLQAWDVPFLCGELGPHLVHFSGCRFSDVVNQQYHTLNLPQFRMVSAAGLTHGGDKVHFSAASLRTLGERFAETYLKMISETD